MRNDTVILNEKQQRFCNSLSRFPAFVGSWGTGKTMCGLVKGIHLSDSYPNNLGLIVRKKFTDLRDSTLKDFERYTGLKVKKDDKEVTRPNGSTIMFRHGEELSGLQNINLGWFMMEQAEEFETAEQFDMLRGRLRRDDVGVRQGLVIAYTNVHKWIWDRWKHRQLEGYELTESNIEDCRRHLPADTVEDWERLKFENPKKYNRYILNSWEDYDLEGAFYASLMSDALKEGRVGLASLYAKDQPVYTFWDLGVRVSDTTVIWCVQFINEEVWLVDYYENHGEGMEHYALWLDRRPYIYGGDYLPHDGRNRLQGQEITTRQEILSNLRRCPVHIVDRHRIEDRIESTRIILPRCKFHQNCRVGVEALNHYRKKKNEILSTEDKPVFAPEPLHDWSSNAADGFGYMAVAHRYMSFQGRRFGKTSEAVPVNANYRSPYANAHNVLMRGLRGGQSPYNNHLLRRP
jgi:hypothetical protein